MVDKKQKVHVRKLPERKPRDLSSITNLPTDDRELPVNEWGRFGENDPPSSPWGGSGGYSSGREIYDDFGHSIYDWG